MNRPLRVLVACEFSGRVRNAFRRMGHDAWSCDLLEAEDGSEFHFQGDVTDYIGGGIVYSTHKNPFHWDIIIAHPPCTHLAVSGARHFAQKIADGRQQEALSFVKRLMDAPVQYIAIENPISIISSKIRKPDQIIQPWQFGHPEFKATCLWLKGLPQLQAYNRLTPPTKESPDWKSWNKVHREPPGPDRWKIRSRTYSGIAEAMAAQWSEFVVGQMRMAA